jgi:predicted NBD/HSP70 family sugar kinase
MSDGISKRVVGIRPFSSINDPDGTSSDRNVRIHRSLLSSSMVGSTNRGLVMQALFDLGPTSRVELARLAGVNRTTISGIVQPLIDTEVLVENDPVPNNRNGGKPARPLWFSPNARPICGVLLMPEAVHACVVTLGGQILAENRMPLPDGTGPVRPIVKIILKSVSAALSEASRPPLGIGVAVGGMVDTDQGSIVAVNLAPALNGYPLAGELSRRFGLPVRLDHHPRALLVGDRWFGKGRGVPQFAVVYTGEVLGGALYFDGHLYRGASGAGGELGHTFVQVDGEVCRCGRRGCWDTIATLGWLRRHARASGLPNADAMDSGMLVALAGEGVEDAAELLDRYARNVAVGIANLQQTVAPNYFILHGDVVLGGKRMIDTIAEHVRQLVPARPGGAIEIVAGDAGDQAALLGAAGLVLSDLLQFSI